MNEALKIILFLWALSILPSVALAATKLAEQITPSTEQQKVARRDNYIKNITEKAHQNQEKRQERRRNALKTSKSRQ